MTDMQAIEFGLRPPYITETASEYYRDVIHPFVRQANVGFSKGHTASSSRCYHWFREKDDKYTYFTVEKNLGENPLL